MTFAHPLALWLALLIPVVVFAFFIRRKLRRRTVPVLFLWEEAIGKSFVQARSFKLRNLLALILALLVTSALIGSILEAIIGDSDAGAVILIVDNSASMNAVEKNGKTRLELAKDEVEKFVANKNEASEALVLSTAGAPTIVSGFTRDAAALRRTIERIDSTELSSAMNETLELARFFGKTRTNVQTFVFSDGCFQGADNFIKSLENDENTMFKRVGERLDNVVVESFEARRSPIGDAAYEATLALANYGDFAVSFDVEIGLNDVLVDLIPVKLEPNERARRMLKYESTEGGVLSARILLENKNANRLTEDDVKLCNLDDFPMINVLLYGNYDRFIQAVFDSQPNVQTTEITEIPEQLDANTLLVVCGDAPETLPKGKVALVAPTSGADLFDVGDESFDTIVEPGVVDSPLTCFLNLSEVRLNGAREVLPREGTRLEVYARSPEAPVIFTAWKNSEKGSPRWGFNFSCSENSIVLRSIFPILFANLIGAARGVDDSSYALNDEEIAAEHDLRSAIGEHTSAKDVNARTGRLPLWKFFAAFAALLATLEFYWYCRRRV